jgi:subtilisin family serine protease
VSEVRDRFIATREPAARSAARTRRAAGAPPETILRDEFAAPIARLESAGLKEAPALEDLPPQLDLGGFVTRAQTVSLIVEPPLGTTAKDLNDLFGDEFVVMPDVELDLPDAADEDTVAAADVKPVDRVIPADAGVAAEHGRGNLGSGAVVAVFDSGCDADHAEFAGRRVDFSFFEREGSKVGGRRGFDTHPRAHGTHVCGTIAGKTVGVAPQVDLIVSSVTGAERSSTTASRLYTALDWLIIRIAEPQYRDKPVILCMSLGFTPKQLADPSTEHTLNAVQALMRECLIENDILPVVAIGNEGEGSVRAPGYYPEVLSVGAVGYDRAVWPRSGGGAGPAGFEAEVNPDLVGFGVGVVSSLDRDIDGKSRYGAKAGTSMAAPYVTGVAALVAAATGLKGNALRERLLASALPLGLPPARVGAGLARVEG